jgi:hypothetical protein
MRFLLRCERGRIVSGLICLIDGETVGSTLLARPYLPDGIVMVAETLAPICLMHQLLASVFPSFVSYDLQPFDCLMGVVPSGIV